MLDTAQELPTAAAKTRAAVWDVIREVGTGGRPFAFRSLLDRLPNRRRTDATIALRYVSELADAGFLAKCNDAICAHSAEYRLIKGVRAATPMPLAGGPEPVTFHTRNLRLEIPRSHDGIWMLMRWKAQRRGAFKLSELLTNIGDNIAADEVRAYVRALTRAGIITPEIAIGADPPYRVDMRHVETPRLRADGTLLVGPQRLANLWRSMKMCAYFTPLDLAGAASLPDLSVSEETAARYAADLAKAGYLIVRTHRDEPTLYRLKPKMITGPAAPEILRARFVWDPNLCRIVGDAVGVEEVRP